MVLTYSPTKNDIECYYSSETGFVISFQHHGFMNKKWVCSSIQEEQKEKCSYYRHCIFNRRTPKGNNALQTEKDFFQPEIRPNLPENCYFLPFFQPKIPQKCFPLLDKVEYTTAKTVFLSLTQNNQNGKYI